MIERSNLPEGIEFAIGGGNPLTTPGIEKFLEIEKSRNHIINVTMNYNHISPNGKYRQQTIDYLKRGLIKGLGVSVMDYNLENFLNDKELQDVSSNIVIHIIEGINSFYNVKEKLFNCNWKHPKVLILGKKNFGRYGMLSEDKKAIDDKQTAIWRENILNFLKEFNGVTSFDNLALERLDVLSKLPKEVVDTQWFGEEGTHTMYLDFVKEEYGRQSTSKDRKPIGDKTFREIYKDVYQHRKDWK
jgi:organic radical activating enzyme